MSQYKTVHIDGRVTLIPDEPPAPPANPSLQELNQSYRQADAERREEIGALRSEAIGAINSAFDRNGKRIQKTLRPAPNAKV